MKQSNTSLLSAYVGLAAAVIAVFSVTQANSKMPFLIVLAPLGAGSAAISQRDLKDGSELTLEVGDEQSSLEKNQ